MAPLLQGLEMSDLALMHVHNFSSWSPQQLIHDSFLLAGSWKKWNNVSTCYTLAETVSYPYGHFNYNFNLNLGTTYCQNFASLGTSASYMANITFPLVDKTESTCQPLLHTSLTAVDLPCKILFVLSFKSKNKNLTN